MPRPSRVCSVLDCGRSHKAHGLCDRHYREKLRKEAVSPNPGPEKSSREVPTASNVHELLGREKKASALAHMIRTLHRDLKFTIPPSEYAKHFTPLTWKAVAKTAGVNPPSDRTKALCIEYLERFPDEVAV